MTKESKGKGDGTDTAADSGREAGPEYPLDPSRPPINPETRRVPVARGIIAPTILEDPRDEDGVISASAPVWEGGDPGRAFAPDPGAEGPDETYWPEADAQAVPESSEEDDRRDRDRDADRDGDADGPGYDPTLPGSNPNPGYSPQAR